MYKRHIETSVLIITFFALCMSCSSLNNIKVHKPNREISHPVNTIAIIPNEYPFFTGKLCFRLEEHGYDIIDVERMVKIIKDMKDKQTDDEINRALLNKGIDAYIHIRASIVNDIYLDNATIKVISTTDGQELFRLTFDDGQSYAQTYSSDAARTIANSIAENIDNL